jgi:hypothetical protein
MGKTSTHTLSLPTMKSRQVRICPNKVIIFQSGSDNEKQHKWTKNTLPDSTTYFNVLLHVDDRKQLNGPTLVNCVDTATDELVHSWLFIIEALEYSQPSEKPQKMEQMGVVRPRYI